MTHPVDLVPLECVQCRTPIPADPDDTAWICKTCGIGLLLDEERGLQTLDIHFVDTRRKVGIRWLPFWVGEGKVVIEKRETYVGLIRMASNLLKSVSDNLQDQNISEDDGREQKPVKEKALTADDAGTDYWTAPKDFVIPAFDCTLEEAAAWGILFLQSPIDFEEGHPRKMEKVTVNKHDAYSLAEFVVLAVEANKKDVLRKVKFTLTLDDLNLWVLPVFDSDDKRQLAVGT
jgi:hypothetical protein